MAEAPIPLRIVNARAPVRICDIGGWTDTWFARHGKVFNIAVDPPVEIQVKVHPIGALPGRVLLDVENYGERYCFEPESPPGRHPLLEATVAEVGLSEDASVEISIYSEVPAGCSTGTSASVAVGLIGALDALTAGRMTPHEIAEAAHRVEVDRLGMQSGVQDQLCAAYGGINYIEVSEYPRASVTQIRPPDEVAWELEQRLVVVFLGRSHVSSHIHDAVIAAFGGGGDGTAQIEELRHAAEQARAAVGAADFKALGRAMIRNTEAQRRLHPALVSAEAQALIDLASAHGALGWKVNGAGGPGGSVTLLGDADMRTKRDLLRRVHAANTSFQVIPVHLDQEGLRVWRGDEVTGA